MGKKDGVNASQSSSDRKRSGDGDVGDNKRKVGRPTKGELAAMSKPAYQPFKIP